MKFYLVLQSQTDGEPFHWSLFACRGEANTVGGPVWQVKGDATYMRLQNADNVNLFKSASYFESYELNADLSESQQNEIKRAVEKERPPEAKDQRSVTENCQGWTIRVLRRLQEKGVVEKDRVDWIESDLKEPIIASNAR